MQMPAAARGVFVLGEGVAPPGGGGAVLGSVTLRRQPPFKVNESRNLPELAKCARSRREQLQRGKYNRDAKKKEKEKQLVNFGRSTRGLRGAILEPRLWIHARRASLAVPGGGIFFSRTK